MQSVFRATSPPTRGSPTLYVRVVGLLGERSAAPVAFFPTQICHGHSSSTICNVTTLRKGLTKREAAGYAAGALGYGQ